jgi:hypothetical protein
VTVHTRPDYGMQVKLPPPEGYPGEPRPDTMGFPTRLPGPSQAPSGAYPAQSGSK